MFDRKILIVPKVVFALLAIGAITQETVVLIDRGTYNFINFWSYFTNQSNLFAAIMLCVGAYALWRGLSSEKLAILRGASSLYMIITGVVFAVLLADQDPELLTAVPIDNTILHYIMPVVMALDWLLDPPQKRIKFTHALVWLAYPLVYVAYALARGVSDSFYPYPFLNPETGGGYQGIAVTVVYILLFVVIMTWLMTRLPWKGPKPAKRPIRKAL